MRGWPSRRTFGNISAVFTFRLRVAAHAASTSSSDRLARRVRDLARDRGAAGVAVATRTGGNTRRDCLRQRAWRASRARCRPRARSPAASRRVRLLRLLRAQSRDRRRGRRIVRFRPHPGRFRRRAACRRAARRPLSARVSPRTARARLPRCFPFHSSPTSVRSIEAAWRASLGLSIMTIPSLRAPRASRHCRARRVPRMLKLTIPALAVGAMSGAAAAEAARAAGAPTDDAAVLLPPVEVVASPLTTPLVIVTDPKTPRQPLPASDGADYLNTIPGFTSVRSGGTNGDPVLRGMFGSRLNILANGMPTLGACPNRMDAPTSYIAPESYDKVTVVKGPQTVLYG